MLENIFIIVGLVSDTFLITSVNDCDWKTNIKTYLGIETMFAIIGFLIGSIILIYCPYVLFKSIGAMIILVLQLVDVRGYEYPEKCNALLLGIDSLIVFATLNWIFIPILTVAEFVAISLGSLFGRKIVCKAPFFVREYGSNIVMILIAISMLL